MATKIQMNILQNTGSYEILHPEIETANITDTVSIAKGGTGSTNASKAVYNLTQSLDSRTASQINSYASNTYLTGYYSTTGYKIPISNLMTYINNNIESNTDLNTMFNDLSSASYNSYTSSDKMLISQSNEAKSFTLANLSDFLYNYAPVIGGGSVEKKATSNSAIAVTNSLGTEGASSMGYIMAYGLYNTNQADTFTISDSTFSKSYSFNKELLLFVEQQIESPTGKWVARNIAGTIQIKNNIYIKSSGSNSIYVFRFYLGGSPLVKIVS